jgi:hypothetical protein
VALNEAIIEAQEWQKKLKQEHIVSFKQFTTFSEAV